VSTRESVQKYIDGWLRRGYSDGIPDEVPHRLMALRKAPSYKAIVQAILRNDMTELGFSRPFSPWYSEIKRVEIEARGGERQLRLF
jgi:predicted phosphoadenosine phosphosulfate sulfurtransferase